MSLFFYNMDSSHLNQMSSMSVADESFSKNNFCFRKTFQCLSKCVIYFPVRRVNKYLTEMSKTAINSICRTRAC